MRLAAREGHGDEDVLQFLDQAVLVQGRQVSQDGFGRPRRFAQGDQAGDGREADAEAAYRRAVGLFEQLTGLDRLLPIDPRPGTVPP